MYWTNIIIAALGIFGSLVFGEENQKDCRVAPEPITDFSKIYQEIWDADQDLNGIQPILKTDPRDKDRGYVVVEEPLVFDGNQEFTMLSEVVIPDSKRTTYELVKKLFDNYSLNQSKPEKNITDEEKAEVAAFINAIKDTAPMKLARKFIEAVKGAVITDEEWYDSIFKIWFEIYDFSDSTPNRSGFEHVFVGEQNGNEIGGYHFWYKYYLDDKATEGYANGKDNINYLGTRYFGNDEEGVSNPNAVTFRYEWDAFDFENGGTEKLYKSTGGFDVGYSAEGLIALGMVCFYDPRSVKTTVIDNVKLEYKLFKAGPGDSSINTFYSMFKGLTLINVPVDGEPEEPGNGNDLSSSDVTIIAALVNPDGSDENKETVSLINTSNRPVNLKGWTIAGNNGNAYKIVDMELKAGEIRTLTLPAKAAQLTNKSAKITLKDANGNIAHEVNYEKNDIKSGYTVVF